jgi:hypothetical protein
MDSLPPPRPVGVSLIALFLGGTALLALLLPLGLLLTGVSSRLAAPFLGASRTLDDPFLLAWIGAHALLLLAAAAGLWSMRRAGLWLALLVSWASLALHLASHWPWWLGQGAGQERGAAAWLVGALLAVDDLLLAVLLGLVSAYLLRRRSLFR